MKRTVILEIRKSIFSKATAKICYSTSVKTKRDKPDALWLT